MECSCIALVLPEQTPIAKSTMLHLPKPNFDGTMSLEESLRYRRSVRTFTKHPLSQQEISSILWAAQGITDDADNRTAPSAGARYPVKLQVATKNGLFGYDSNSHALTNLKPEDVRPMIVETTVGQKFIADAGLVVILSANCDESIQLHGEKAMRYIYLEAGHIAQNIHLEAASLGLASSPVAAFDEAALQSALGLPDGWVPIYVIPVGHPKLPIPETAPSQRNTASKVKKNCKKCPTRTHASTAGSAAP
jgi:SagB-type dehydrogenase family enzyme